MSGTRKSMGFDFANDCFEETTDSTDAFLCINSATDTEFQNKAYVSANFQSCVSYSAEKCGKQQVNQQNPFTEQYRSSMMQMKKGKQGPTNSNNVLVSSLPESCTDVRKDLHCFKEQFEGLIKESANYREMIQGMDKSIDMYKKQIQKLKNECTELTEQLTRELQKREEIAKSAQNASYISSNMKQNLTEIKNITTEYDNIVTKYKDWNERKLSQMHSSCENYLVDLEDFKAKYEELTNKYSKEKSDIEGEQQKLALFKAGLQNELKNMRVNLISQRKASDLLKTEESKIKIKEKENNENLSVLKQTLEKSTADYQERYTVLKAKRESLQSENINLKITEAKYAALEAECKKVEERGKVHISDLKVSEDTKALEKQHFEQQVENEKLQRELEEKQKKVSSLWAIIAEKEKQLNEEVKKQEDMTVEYNGFEKEYNRLRTELDAVKAERDKLIGESNSASLKVQELKKILHDLEEQNAKAKSQIQKLRNDVKVTEDSSASKRQLEDKEHNCRELSAVISHLENDISRKEETISALSFELLNIHLALNAAQVRESCYEQEIASTNEEYEARYKELMNSMQVYQQQLTEQLKDTESEKEKLEMENKKMEEDIFTADNEKSVLDDEIATAKAALAISEKKISDLELEGETLLQGLNKMQQKLKEQKNVKDKEQYLMDVLRNFESENINVEERLNELKILKESNNTLKSEIFSVKKKNEDLAEEQKNTVPTLQLPASQQIPQPQTLTLGVFDDETRLNSEVEELVPDSTQESKPSDWTQESHDDLSSLDINISD